MRNPAPLYLNEIRPFANRLDITVAVDGMATRTIRVPGQLALPVLMCVQEALFGTEADLEIARAELAQARHDLLGMSYTDVAEQMGMSKKTLWTKRMYAQKGERHN